MSERESDDGHVREAVDCVRALFPAHAEAEAFALGEMLGKTLPPPPPSLYFLVSQVIASHLAQETALAHLLEQRVGTPAFVERARYVRQLLVHHADHEATRLHPALPDHIPDDVVRRVTQHYVDQRAHLLAIHTRDELARSA